MRFTKRQLKKAILQVQAEQRPRLHVHMSSIIGQAIARSEGLAERALGMGQLDVEERALAKRAYDELRTDGLIHPSFQNATDPDNWCLISERGQALLARHMLDELDEALVTIAPDLVDLRDGAHDAMRGSGSDSARQAAASATEMVNQVLQRAAPIEEVRARPWFERDPSAASGVTREQRVRLILEKHGREDFADSADLIRAALKALDAMRHRPGSTSGLGGEDAVLLAEVALKRLLLGLP
jgi:hypothetical protein